MGNPVQFTSNLLLLCFQEVDRLKDALKKEEFRKLLVDYAKEISDPENRKRYEEEIAQLERNRGQDVKFLHPKVHTYVRTYVCMHVRTCVPTYVHTHVRTCVPMNIHTYVHTCMYVSLCSLFQVRTCVIHTQWDAVSTQTLMYTHITYANIHEYYIHPAFKFVCEGYTYVVLQWNPVHSHEDYSHVLYIRDISGIFHHQNCVHAVCMYIRTCVLCMYIRTYAGFCLH